MRRYKVRKTMTANVRNVIVLSLSSVVIALPMLSLPLGFNEIFAPVRITQAQNQVALADTTLSSNPTLQATLPVTLSASELDYTDVSLNRSQSDIATDTRVESAEIRLDAAMAASTEPVLTEVDYQVYIAADVLNVRTDATTVGEIVAKITRGDRIQVIGEYGNWLQVEADDQIGFISAEYTSTEMVFRQVDETVYVKGTSLNVRTSYDEESAILVNLKSGSKLHRTGIGDEWSSVEQEDGQIGYVASKYLTKIANTSSKTTLESDTPANAVDSDTGSDVPSNSSGNTIVDLAYQALGTPYVYGSESLKGMDCSGLVNWAYNQIGVSVPRSSASFGSAGEGVSIDNAEPGDVLCIDARPRDGRSRITHVAIYIGDGQVIHASTSQRSVVVSSVASFYDVGYSILSVRRFPN
ncbi:MAG: NlpC/P60 family protein [Eubacteriales bacterium]|nr:NlpC/P60 family protein [Eubacteriales bacterium]